LDMNNLSTIKEIILADNITSLKVYSEEETSYGKKVMIFINDDSRLTQLDFVKIDGKWYVGYILGRYSMNIYSMSPAVFSIINYTLSEEGLLTISLQSSSGIAIENVKLLTGTGNCRNFNQLSSSPTVLNLKDNFNFTMKCTPKILGNFVAKFTGQYFLTGSDTPNKFEIRIMAYEPKTSS